jgi:uncharacterized protein HemX
MQKYVRSFLRNIELWLSLAGLVVILGVPAVVVPERLDAFWKVAAITAIGVGLLHGILFWTVRRRQRTVREEAIAEIREMLADRVKNHLAVLHMYLPDEGEDARLAQQELDGMYESIDEIAEQMDTISEKSIQEWRGHYAEAVDNATDLETA